MFIKSRDSLWNQNYEEKEENDVPDFKKCRCVSFLYFAFRIEMKTRYSLIFRFT